MQHLEDLSPLELLRVYGDVLDELRKRGIARTGNNPIGDYAEWLVTERLHLTLSANSTFGYDATDSSGKRYQIKARRGGIQLSAIRNAEQALFDYLIAVMFSQDFSISIALKIPQSLVLKMARYTIHTNSHTLLINSAITRDPRVENITKLLEHSSHNQPKSILLPSKPELDAQGDKHTSNIDYQAHTSVIGRTPVSRETTHNTSTQTYLERLIQTAGKTNFITLCEPILQGSDDDLWLMSLINDNNTLGSKRSILSACRRLIREGHTRETLRIIQSSNLSSATIQKATKLLSNLDT